MPRLRGRCGTTGEESAVFDLEKREAARAPLIG
uniref:Uncharacterized protein n=1 Tax=Anguilla anguilla TaxID=7936 RepID=A0A0E9QCI2_ANGAN